jgi:hypothetical protein
MKIKFVFAILAISSILAFAACNGSSKKNEPKPQTEQPVKVEYTCTMHPQIIRDAPGKCPICGMELVKKEPEKK